MKSRIPRKHLSQTQFIALGFLAVILIGTILLMLPVSSRSREAGGFVNSFFIAASATCVTGLVAYDTWRHWSLSGQLVILLLIQIGGLGFIVWDDLSRNKLQFRRYMLHTKIVLMATAVLIFGGALLWWIYERGNLLAGVDVQGQVLASQFSSVQLLDVDRIIREQK